MNNEQGRSVTIMREKEVNQHGAGTPSRRSVVFGRH